ncbi:U3 small nucleolar RNA-associated protein 6 homolog [Mus musculus]|uniref:U3 small nucleolar RNA-associated protein 6 homolog n=3 Tax=Mus musculus TaxID=10090 RepID=UTP6_MOUSE|nr:U3 small nucleolar RNA-associated protein 6 homolog [Mus musculus]Q8VCY6.1 RecName: Full=U3 small nucleolar RNA-associated protein 6 homolog; AltName: Full=Multiple hat domains protein [Mus musculus]AAH18250.1 UTP6, small subunit (SSU) processome component, homolog (yeast) [Mus musculus]AAH23920.1 UTP6, small subunit (SSU) processome component, homolog (yeast) [Mus musculus]AAH24850.1 UTP6, small subunit (SSU) processome component, homolog (yeast) [Mus musculus]EDL15614.1 UTP6, small subuni|eukprot:NP_659075.1 U3 small nucleolar RNA-associated protein 6 homolog [Mus musculus]
MAEIIQERIEDRIPELEQLERIGLFSHAEIKAIIKKASDLEYKIHRRTLLKEDFINYVQYEINLLELIQRRRARIKYSFKKDEIEYSMVHRVQGVFGRASAKWKDDVQLWLSYIVFCKKWGTKTHLSKIFSAMLAIHSNKPALWIMAAKWEMEDRLSSESARQLFLRALRFHPECPKLYQEYFRMELMHAEKLRKEKQEFEKAAMDMGDFDHPEEILKGELARIIYKNSISKIKGAEFHVSLLAIAQLFDFAKDLQKEIYDDLQALHTDDPLTWDYVARRELEIESQPGEEQPVSKQAKAVEMGRREERCCAVYEEAVKALPTEAMWKCYITFCLERFSKKTSSVPLRGQRLERTMLAFRKAHELKLLSEVQYKQWIDLLLRQDLFKEALQVAEAGTELFKDSVTMWQTKLQVLIDSKSPDVEMRFEEAFAHLKPQVCLPLWISWAEWSESAKSQEDTEAIFKKAIIAVTGASSVTLKEKYLDWAYRSGGYKKARAVFKSLQESRPFSVEFFRKMMQFEKEQEPCKMVNLREYYERALREFGTSDSDLWMDYIKEELNHPFGKPENCGQIYWRAMKMLQGQSAELFVAKHAMHQAGH